MRTNIVLDDDLMEEAMQYSKARTKRELVAEALQTFVEVKAAARRRLRYEERLLDLRGRLASVQLRESPLSVLRADRDRT